MPTAMPRLPPHPQERHAIGLAIRREVGRRYRKLVLAGGKPEGSSKLWQQVGVRGMPFTRTLQHACLARLRQLPSCLMCLHLSPARQTLPCRHLPR